MNTRLYRSRVELIAKIAVFYALVKERRKQNRKITMMDFFLLVETYNKVFSTNIINGQIA